MTFIKSLKIIGVNHPVENVEPDVDTNMGSVGSDETAITIKKPILSVIDSDDKERLFDAQLFNAILLNDPMLFELAAKYLIGKPIGILDRLLCIVKGNKDFTPLGYVNVKALSNYLEANPDGKYRCRIFTFGLPGFLDPYTINSVYSVNAIDKILKAGYLPVSGVYVEPDPRVPDITERISKVDWREVVGGFEDLKVEVDNNLQFVITGTPTKRLTEWLMSIDIPTDFCLIRSMKLIKKNGPYAGEINTLRIAMSVDKEVADDDLGVRRHYLEEGQIETTHTLTDKDLKLVATHDFKAKHTFVGGISGLFK